MNETPMIYLDCPEFGARATLAALRALADANAGRPFDPWAGAPLVPRLYASLPACPDLTSTVITTTDRLAALLATVPSSERAA